MIEELFEERETSDWDLYVLDTFKRLSDKFSQGLLEDPYVVRRLEWLLKLKVVEDEIADFEYNYIPKGKFDYRSMYQMDERMEKKIAASFEITNLCDHDLYEQVADKVGAERILTEADIGEALLAPPKNSRAELRVKIASEFDNAALYWNKITITKEPRIKIDLSRPTEEEYSRLFERYPELARMPSAVVVFLRERRRGETTRQVMVRLLAEEEDIRGWEEDISQEVRNRLVRNPYLDYLLYSNNKTYRFDDLDGWDEASIRKKIEEIRKEERLSEDEEL